MYVLFKLQLQTTLTILFPYSLTLMFKLATIRYIRYQVNYYPVKSGKVVSGTSLPTIQSYKVKNIDDAAMTLAGLIK